MRRVMLIIGACAFAGAVFMSCGKKSEANKEQIEDARQEAEEMVKGFDASKSLKPSSGKVSFDTSTVTEVVVTEDVAPSAGE